MLTELVEIERGLVAAGVLTAARHPDNHPLAKRAVLRARVSAEGTVTGVEVIPPEDADKFWTLRDGNHNSFPRVPIGSGGKPRPLRSATDPKLIEGLQDKDAGKRLVAFHELYKRSALDLSELVPWPSYHDRLRERQKGLASLLDTEARAVQFLLQRVLSKKDGSGSDGSALLKTLDSAISRAVIESPDAALVTLAAKILFTGEGEVLLDTEAGEELPRTACDPRNMHEISEALNQSAQRGSVARCALTGQLVEIEDDKLPQATLPILGPTYLYSKNSDIPSAWRYGVAGPQGFPVSRELVRRLKDAAEALASKERKGRTWSGVASERPKQYDLLLAFIPDLEDVPAAAALAGDEAAFEELASRLIDLRKGHDVGFSEHARFIVLRKVDLGNRKVIFTTATGVKDLAEAASRWKDGCRNTPDVRLAVPQGRGKRAERRGPGWIAPGSIIALGREIFIRGGTERCQAPGPTFANAMGLFLGPGLVRTGIARRLLRLFVARRGPSIAGIAHASRRGDLKGFDAKSALETISVFGLLLQELGRKKETYMIDAAFQLGQLLAGADVLHRGFCEDQRGGSVPSALLGNQALALAQRSPVAALDLLCNRWRVYSGWADKKRNSIAKPGDKAASKDWAIYSGVRIGWKLRPLAETLHNGLLPDRADDRFRAELLLGYIAGPPAPPRPSGEPPSSQTTDSEED